MYEGDIKPYLLDVDTQDALEERGWGLDLPMNNKEAFREFCEWEGLIGWGDRLWDLVEQLQDESNR